MSKMFEFVADHLRVKIMVSMAVIVVITVGFLVYLGVSSQTKSLKEEMYISGHELSEMTYAGIKHPMSTGNGDAVERQLMDMKQKMKGGEVLICDFDGNIAYATSEHMLGTDIAQHLNSEAAISSLEDLLNTGNIPEKAFEEVLEGKRSIITIEPILNEKACYHCHGSSRRILGGLIIKQPADSVYAAIASSRNKNILIGLIGICAFLAVSYWLFSRIVTNPVGDLVEKALRVAEGDTSVSVEVRSKDAIGTLGGAFNTMVSNIRAQIEKEKAQGHYLQGQVDNISSLMAALAKGDLSKEIRAEHDDEIGKLIASINEMVEFLRDTAKIAERIAEGDLTVQAKPKCEQDVLGNAFAGMVDKLKVLIGEVTTVSTQVSSACSQVSASSQQLAEGAATQAASLQETSSSLEEMSSMTKQNAENAQHAHKLMEETKQTVDRANESMKEMSVSMEEIVTGSEETRKIIKTIDEIAFQTNLLALNAAVEAARAGEAGMGFAVVADEVRNLAQRAAQAAKNTADLIDGTIKKISDGSALVKKTDEAFSDVAKSAKKGAELVAEIAGASQEQSRGIEQVNDAVAQMDKITQQNASGAEESASATEEMAAQSKSLLDLLRNFEIDGNGEVMEVVSNKPLIEPQITAGIRESNTACDTVKGTERVKPDEVIPMCDEDFKDF